MKRSSPAVRSLAGIVAATVAFAPTLAAARATPAPSTTGWLELDGAARVHQLEDVGPETRVWGFFLPDGTVIWVREAEDAGTHWGKVPSGTAEASGVVVARYYDSRRARWVSPEPLRAMNAPSPAHLADYSYAQGNPVRNVTSALTGLGPRGGAQAVREVPAGDDPAIRAAAHARGL